MRRLRIAVISGGRTAEHEISRLTGAMVIAGLDRRRYLVKPVVISRDGRWHAARGFPPAGQTAGRRRYGPAGEAITRLARDRVDCAFIAMHGPFGEDGTIQGMLEMLDIDPLGVSVDSLMIIATDEVAQEVEEVVKKLTNFD